MEMEHQRHYIGIALYRACMLHHIAVDQGGVIEFSLHRLLNSRVKKQVGGGIDIEFPQLSWITELDLVGPQLVQAAAVGFSRIGVGKRELIGYHLERRVIRCRSDSEVL